MHHPASSHMLQAAHVSSNSIARARGLVCQLFAARQRLSAQDCHRARRLFHNTCHKRSCSSSRVVSSSTSSKLGSSQSGSCIPCTASGRGEASGSEFGSSGGSSGSSSGDSHSGGGRGGNGGSSSVPGGSGDSGSNSGRDGGKDQPQYPRWYQVWMWATALTYLAWRWQWRHNRRLAAQQVEREQQLQQQEEQEWGNFARGYGVVEPLPPRATATTAAGAGGRVGAADGVRR